MRWPIARWTRRISSLGPHRVEQRHRAAGREARVGKVDRDIVVRGEEALALQVERKKGRVSGLCALDQHFARLESEQRHQRRSARLGRLGEHHRAAGGGACHLGNDDLHHVRMRPASGCMARLRWASLFRISICSANRPLLHSRVFCDGYYIILRTAMCALTSKL
jgi:hypothetical protein